LSEKKYYLGIALNNETSDRCISSATKSHNEKKWIVDLDSFSTRGVAARRGNQCKQPLSIIGFIIEINLSGENQ